MNTTPSSETRRGVLWRAGLVPVTDMTDRSELADIGVNARRYASPEHLAGGSATRDPTSTTWQSCSPRLSPAFTTTWRACCLRFRAAPLVVARLTRTTNLRCTPTQTYSPNAFRRVGRPLTTSPAPCREPVQGPQIVRRAGRCRPLRTRQAVVERLLHASSAHPWFREVGSWSSSDRGSGKSSVVKAALLRRCGRRTPGSAEWYAVTVTPGAHPYEELEAALLRVAVKPHR